MTRSRFASLVVSFNELSCGICSESFEDGELKEFEAICICLLNRDSILNKGLKDLFDIEWVNRE